MNLVVDENIVLAEEAFSQFGNVRLYNGREITSSALKDADALIIRSVTEVNQSLLQAASVRFVGTATIGTDHVDEDFLKKRGIVFASAQGCNSFAVAEYVASAIFHLSSLYNLNLRKCRLGIIGVGNIGSKVRMFAESTGMKVICSDPPLQRLTGTNDFFSLDEILSSEIITLHVPLTFSGANKTFNLLNEENLKKTASNAVIINTSRGGVINENEILRLNKSKKFILINDVWENEPDVNLGILKESTISTPHIAGYSVEGRVNGTKMIYDALCEWTDSEKKWKPELSKLSTPVITLSGNERLEEAINKVLKSVYDIQNDSDQFKLLLDMNKADRLKHFDKMRKEYHFRREFNNFTVQLDRKNDELINVLKALRFTVK
jgi:erythronate-4-phosphate dehydrogenase